ncbi:MAG: glycosyltransferase [Rhodobacter sp.]|nr:glycosyltransferase [Rhodobacter sp.]
MSILRLLSPAKAARFATAVRQEGWRVAIEKSRAHLALALGHGRSALDGGAGQGKPRTGPDYLTRFWRETAQAQALHAAAAPATLTNRRRIALIGDLNLPQCRKYRVDQLAELWDAQGWQYDYAHEGDIARAVGLMQDATHLMFYRTRNTAQTSMYLYEARRLRLPVAYDIDDPLFSVAAYQTYGNMGPVGEHLQAHFISEAPKYLDAMNLADIVTVSTPGLARHARELTPRPVHVRRNFADAATLAAGRRAMHPRHPRAPGEPFTAAFASGSMGHEADFAEIADDMAAFVTAAPDRRLLILGHFDPKALPEALRARTEFTAFSDYESYLAALARADCAVMPLADDLFNRCKSAVRVIDAAAVAAPSLVSPVGDLSAVVAQGETGRVLEIGQSWADALEALADDRAACAAMGHAARARIETHWTAGAGEHIVDPALLDWIRQ